MSKGLRQFPREILPVCRTDAYVGSQELRVERASSVRSRDHSAARTHPPEQQPSALRSLSLHLVQLSEYLVSDHLVSVRPFPALLLSKRLSKYRGILTK